MSKRIIMIDASAMGASSCLLRTYYSVINGYRSKLNANDIEYGSAFHKFVAELELTNGNFAKAQAAALAYFNRPMIVKTKKKYLDKNHLMLSMIEYHEQRWGKDTFEVIKDDDGKPMVECRFAFPYYTDDKIEVLLCGTIDKIGRFKNGCYAIGDYKTTSSWEKSEYFNGYRLSPQMYFYISLLNRIINHPDCTNTQLLALKDKPIGVFIDGIFLKPAGREFERSEIFFFKKPDMDEFESLLESKVKSIVDYVSRSMIPLRQGMLNGACKTVYGNCSFFNVCSAPDKVASQHILKHMFTQTPYNPLSFGE